MNYFCGEFKGHALTIMTGTENIKAEGCGFCINYYISKPLPIYVRVVFNLLVVSFCNILGAELQVLSIGA
jgi:hypothetical protein